MKARKRKWTTVDGERKEAWVVVYAINGKRHQRTFGKRKDADGWIAKTQLDVRNGTHVPDSVSLTVREAGKQWIEACKTGTPERPALERATWEGYEQHLKHHIEDDLELGVDIPKPDEIRAIIKTLEDEKWRRRWRPLILTAIFTGLRASELRGLRWKDVDLEQGKIQVRQRRDRYGDEGPPKSKAGRRTVPLTGPKLTAVLREWKLKCTKGSDDLVFPNGIGRVESHANIINRCWWPLQIAAGVARIAKDADSKVVLGEDGEPVRKPRYSGLHALRHFYASWCINSEAAGGLGLPPKAVQTRLGHSSITMTMDTYGHLFPGDDHADKSAAGEARLWAQVSTDAA